MNEMERWLGALHAALARNYDRLDRVLEEVGPSAKRTSRKRSGR